MDVFTASLRSACSLHRGHFVNNLKRLILVAFCIFVFK
ncbi:gluconate 5-dehydrogenase [Yersinia pseudotuberculosis]